MKILDGNIEIASNDKNIFACIDNEWPLFMMGERLIVRLNANLLFGDAGISRIFNVLGRFSPLNIFKSRSFDGGHNA